MFSTPPAPVNIRQRAASIRTRPVARILWAGNLSDSHARQIRDRAASFVVHPVDGVSSLTSLALLYVSTRGPSSIDHTVCTDN